MISRVLGMLTLCGSLAGCDLVFGLYGEDDQVAVDGGAGDADAGRERRRALRIAHGSPEMLVDFPLSVVIDDPDLARVARSDGADIRFETLEGAPLPTEIASYENGRLDAFVRVTLLPSNAAETRIALVYGGEVVGRALGEAWGPRFAHVWHLDGVDADEPASTGAATDLTTIGASVQSSAGVIGGARVLTDAVSIDNRPSLCQRGVSTTWPGASAFSLSLWFNAASVPVGQYATPFEAGGYQMGAPGVSIQIDHQGGAGRVLALLTDSAGAHEGFELVPAIAYGEWHHYALTYQQTGVRAAVLFVDGERVGRIPATMLGSTITPSDPICLGGRHGFGGAVDEVRAYDESVSDAWFAAEYANVANRSSFVVLDD